MKKNFLVAAFAVLAIGFSSCGEQNVSKTECLTIKDGWQLSEGRIDPAYEMEDGSQTSDLFDYLYACEYDDVLTFDAEGNEVIATNVRCETGIQADKADAKWHFDNEEDPQTLFMQLPFFYNDDETFYDAEEENCKIINLTKDEMKIAYTFTDDAGKHTFTMTYLPSSKVAKK